MRALRHPAAKDGPMGSSDPLTLFEEPSGLRQPILILAFSGWNDAAESATTAARYLGQIWPSEPLASIDPEEFYHFGLSRPHVRFKDGSRTEREIVWPSTDFSLSRSSALERDLVVGVAMEPHLKWRTYCGVILDLARRAGASLVLTLGALLAEVPHTRAVRLVGGTQDPALASKLGIRPSRYEGPTGIVGVLNTICREAGMPTASLWANVPHYVSGVENPKAALALVRRVLTLLGTEADLSDLIEATRQFERNLDEVVGQNPKIAEYVRKLESRPPDEEGSAEPEPPPPPGDELPPSADLVAEIEQFLRQHRPESP
jgi:proteasome assembly chaperone (PAC2) family protein